MLDLRGQARTQGLEIAVDEAQDYGNQVNALSPGLVRFATGIAGTPDEPFYVSTSYWDNNEWRYHYARSVKLNELVVELPARNGTIDIQAMATAVRSQMGAT